ncbi:hypothetical protein [uncultured Erythrobacter sp.]|uniref:hypothetical protein n=1 Tax=uncultured Erythrobacter sp. TaxID=263913 RepID=UPI00260FED22|nr:hypothetical protein [uncultured Erythrobacter sp.]
MIAEIAYPLALIASVLWFSAAFRYFSFQQLAAAKVLVPKSARHSPVFLTTAALARFLGGMNAALALLSLMLVVLWATESTLFSNSIERGLLLLVLAAAHFSQFIFNVPILRNGERQGESYWYVLSGPMFFIFAMDAAQAIISLIAAIAQFAG